MPRVDPSVVIVQSHATYCVAGRWNMERLPENRGS